MAIWRSRIAKQAMPFGDHLSLNKQRRFGYVLLLNIRQQFGNKQSPSVRGFFFFDISYR
jgi:hypothetical protein